jgi:hypothetical protein
MDTSKNYIKMCTKADEIKSYWEPEQGDYFYGLPKDIADMEYERGVYRVIISEDEFYSIIPENYDLRKKEFSGFGEEDEPVFLPRQDNLQKMIDYELPYDLISRFSEWAAGLELSMRERLKTMEQIWLAYVMWQNHAKIWSGREWEHVSSEQYKR